MKSKMTEGYALHASDIPNMDTDTGVYPGRVGKEVFEKYPPTCVFTSEYDFLQHENVELARRI